MENQTIKQLTLINRSTNQIETIICSLDDNFVIIKKKLSEKIDADEQTIQLYQDKLPVLNVNNLVSFDTDTIYYDVFERPIKEVILEIRNNHFGVPRWILINSNATVEQLTNEISNFQQNGLQTFLFNENGEMLDNNRTIESCKLESGSKLKVWRGQNLLVKMKLYFYLNNFQNNPTSATLEFSMTDSISEVKNRISEEISPGNALNLALITDYSYWQNNKRLIDYPIKQEGTEVYVVDLQMQKNIKIGDQIKKGKYAKQFEAKGDFDREMILYRYDMDDKSINEKRILKYEIITRTFLSRSSVLKFAELITMYEDSKYFYIAIENTGKGSLKTLYKESPLSENDIIDYSIQICEALDYMHSNKFIHRNLRCSSVLVDNENKIKLTNFHLSKYLFYCTTEQLLDGIPGSKISSGKCWMAPEVLRNDPYGLKADIWSFGVTVLEMVTGKRPYAEMNVVLASHKIVEENAIVYERIGLSESITSIIDRCLHSCQWERPTAKQCIQLFKCIAN